MNREGKSGYGSKAAFFSFRLVVAFFGSTTVLGIPIQIEGNPPPWLPSFSVQAQRRSGDLAPLCQNLARMVVEKPSIELVSQIRRGHQEGFHFHPTW